LSLRSDNLDSVGELYTEDDFRQLIATIEATPPLMPSPTFAHSSPGIQKTQFMHVPAAPKAIHLTTAGIRAQ
jgi:hypothetical protein